MNTYYLRVEGVNLSNFVYDTQDLSTVRGGGLLLLEAVERVKEKLIELAGEANVSPVSTGASSGLFKITTEKSAENIKNKVVGLLNGDKQLKHATFVVDVLSIDPTKSFAWHNEKLIAKNRWQQMQSPSLAVPSIQKGCTMACSTDLVRPQSSEPLEGKDGRISVSVFERRKHGIDSKLGEFYRKIPRSTHADVAFSKEAEVTSAWLGNPQFKLAFTSDLDQLSSDNSYGNLHNKIAVIYADGNSFGKMQLGFDEKTQMDFDKKLKAYRSSFMLELLARMQKETGWKNKEKYRIETLLWGGDEFMLVVPAWKGWETLELFFDKSSTWNFTYKNNEGTAIDKKLTHSAGLVFCHHDAPIHDIKDIAHDLAEICKSVEKDDFCKKMDDWEERSPVSTKGNYFAFQVLESFANIHGGLERYRQRICPKGVHHGALIVDGSKMKAIGESICLIKADEKTSRGRLHGIVKDLVAGKIKDAADDAKKLTDATASATQEEMNKLSKLFSGERSRWFQLSELWDYVCPRKRGDK